MDNIISFPDVLEHFIMLERNLVKSIFEACQISCTLTVYGKNFRRKSARKLSHFVLQQRLRN